MDSIIDSLKENAWIAAIVLLVVAVFRDAIRSLLSKALGAASRALYNRLAGSLLFRRRALKKYRRGLVSATEKIAVPFRPNRPLILSDIYIGLRAAGKGQEGTRPQEAWDLLARHPRVMVTGPPGAGKSMLLRHLASAKAQNEQGDRQRPLPALLELHRLIRSAEGGDSIEAHLVDAFERYGFPGARKVIRTALEKGRLLLLLDGFDEVPTKERAEVAAKLNDFLARQRDCPVVITCRTAVYRGEFESVTDQIVELEPFEDVQIQAFLESWTEPWPIGKSASHLMAALREQPKLLTAARNPLLLTIITHLYSDRPDYVLPRSRAEFYQQAASILLDQWQQHLAANEFERSEKSSVLTELALRMQDAVGSDAQDRRTIERDEAIARVSEIMPNLGRKGDQATAIIREIVERSGLLLSIDGGSRYAFAHLTFQEYFAAEGMLNRPTDLLEKFTGDPDSWREVALLWCGLVDNCTTMVDSLRTIDSQVALDCIAEARSVDPDLAADILRPTIDAVVSGRASETVRKSLGAVAADVRPRGTQVLEALVEELGKATKREALESIAAALAASNRSAAAEAIADRVEDEVLSEAVIRLGDLGVARLEERARAGESIATCVCLTGIGTPAAGLALANVMIRGGALATPAAWGVAKVVGNQAVADAIAEKFAHVAKGHSPLEWIWQPFDQSKAPGLCWIVGLAATLIQATDDLEEAIATPDPRIAAALVAKVPSQLDEPMAALGSSEPETVVKGDQLAVRLIEQGPALKLEFLSPEALRYGPPDLSAHLRDVRVRTYRDLLGFVSGLSRRMRSRDETDLVEELRDLFLDLIAAVPNRPVWIHLLLGMEPGIRAKLLNRLGEGGQATRESWPAVNREVLYTFERSWFYAAALAIVAGLSLLGLAGGAFLVLGGADSDLWIRIGAGFLCLSIVEAWVFMFIDSSPSQALGRVDEDVLMEAVFFPVVTLEEGLVDWETVAGIPINFFAAGTLLLAGVALAQPLSWIAAVLALAAIVVIFVTLWIAGNRREMAMRTPLAGLFLQRSERFEHFVRYRSFMRGAGGELRMPTIER